MQPPKQAIAPAGVQDPDKMRQVQFMKAMDRGISSLQFDGGAWLARFQSAGDATARADAATRMLLAVAPQSPPDPRDQPIAVVRGIVLDASYQLK